MKTIEIVVSGRVQGVGFRACIRRVAMNIGITGEVMNLPDGKVRILATGDLPLLDKFVSMLYGCTRVVIRDMQIADRSLSSFHDFSIVRQKSQ
ncbi:MAG: acylphosphatase [Methanomicrobiales archaeon]|nr:acylphosphatase [Methanomicrobiales archaeon]